MRLYTLNSLVPLGVFYCRGVLCYPTSLLNVRGNLASSQSHSWEDIHILYRLGLNFRVTKLARFSATRDESTFRV